MITTLSARRHPTWHWFFIVRLRDYLTQAYVCDEYGNLVRVAYTPVSLRDGAALSWYDYARP